MLPLELLFAIVNSCIHYPLIISGLVQTSQVLQKYCLECVWRNSHEYTEYIMNGAVNGYFRFLILRNIPFIRSQIVYSMTIKPDLNICPERLYWMCLGILFLLLIILNSLFLLLFLLFLFLFFFFILILLKS